MAKSWDSRITQALKRGYFLSSDNIAASDWTQCSLGERIKQTTTEFDYFSISREAADDGVTYRNLWHKISQIGLEFCFTVRDAHKCNGHVSCRARHGYSATDKDMMSNIPDRKILIKAEQLHNQIKPLWERAWKLHLKWHNKLEAYETENGNS